MPPSFKCDVNLPRIMLYRHNYGINTAAVTGALRGKTQGAVFSQLLSAAVEEKAKQIPRKNVYLPPLFVYNSAAPLN